MEFNVLGVDVEEEKLKSGRLLLFGLAGVCKRERERENDINS